jgi:hypothetical protein
MCKALRREKNPAARLQNKPETYGPSAPTYEIVWLARYGSKAPRPAPFLIKTAAHLPAARKTDARAFVAVA